MPEKRIAHVHALSGVKRKRPSTLTQDYILSQQGNRCFYCGLKFGEWFRDKKRNVAVLRKVNWDHLSPYSFTFNSNDTNFVASCSRCNGIKGSKVFDTFEEAATFVRERLAAKGYDMAEKQAAKLTKKRESGSILSEHPAQLKKKQVKRMDVAAIKLKLKQVNDELALINRISAHEAPREEARSRSTHTWRDFASALRLAKP